jgi:hypothetical protein
VAFTVRLSAVVVSEEQHRASFLFSHRPSTKSLPREALVRAVFWRERQSEDSRDLTVHIHSHRNPHGYDFHSSTGVSFPDEWRPAPLVAVETTRNWAWIPGWSQRVTGPLGSIAISAQRLWHGCGCYQGECRYCCACDKGRTVPQRVSQQAR